MRLQPSPYQRWPGGSIERRLLIRQLRSVLAAPKAAEPAAYEQPEEEVQVHSDLRQVARRRAARTAKGPLAAHMNWMHHRKGAAIADAECRRCGRRQVARDAVRRAVVAKEPAARAAGVRCETHRRMSVGRWEKGSFARTLRNLDNGASSAKGGSAAGRACSDRRGRRGATAAACSPSRLTPMMCNSTRASSSLSGKAREKNS